MDTAAVNYRRYLEGDDEGMVEVIRDHKDGLTLYLAGIVGNIFTAEELTEETFFKLVVKKPRFAGKSSFKTWLYAIGRNMAIDHLRRSKRVAPIPENASDALAEEEAVESAYIVGERRIAIHRALKQLSPDYRQVLYLLYFEELTGDETAKAMNRTRRQVENLAYRARLALRSVLEKEGISNEDI
ncbi:MAG: RNA polymerase sigma factor [Clostridia bacterium]|nr:RNA polymerase sigma factor [Clostridia bacterium]